MNARLLAMLVCLCLAGPVQASLLDKADWKVTGPDGQPIAAVTDNDLHTAWTGPGPQVTGQAITIDLGRAHVIQRVVLDPGASICGFPRSLDVSIGDAPDALKPCAAMVPTEDQVKVLTFAPAAGRYVRLAIGREQAGYSWVVAEVDLYGHKNVAALAEDNAVVVATNAPQVMRQAAEDLGFYLGQITSGAYPVLAPEQSAGRRGRIFRLETPAPLKPGLSFQETMDLEQFSIAAEGREIVFRGRTPRAVWYAVKEFLERQGVRWTYPAAHGDLIPEKKKLDVAFLPLKWKPPVVVRHWNNSVRGSVTSESYLWLVRNGLNGDWGTLDKRLGDPCALRSICWGTTHTTSALFGDGDLRKSHPEWYEGTSNKTGWAVMPDVTAPGLIDFCINRMKEEEQKRNASKTNPGSWPGFGIHPTDVPAWAVSARAEKLLGPFEKRVDPLASDTAAMGFDYSNLYGYWLDQVARRMEKELPGKLLAGTAYENHYLPPTKVEKFPPNVFILICAMAQPYNLPFASPKSARMRNVFEQWTTKSSMLGLWDYALIMMDMGGYWPAQVPLVSAFAERYEFLAKHGFVWLGTQGAEDIYNPWNCYAFARSTYKPGVSGAELIDEFFQGYFKEAAAPMRRYYTTFENHLIQHDIGLEGGFVYFCYVPVKEAFPPAVVAEMKAALQQARQSAVHGFVKERIARVEEGFLWSLAKAGVGP